MSKPFDELRKQIDADPERRAKVEAHKKAMEEYTRTPVREDNLLVYLETCAVDNNGYVDRRKVNEAEIAWMEEWDEKGFITLSGGALHVLLSDEAWANAHQLRRARAERYMNRDSS